MDDILSCVRVELAEGKLCPLKTSESFTFRADNILFQLILRAKSPSNPHPRSPSLNYWNPYSYRQVNAYSVYRCPNITTRLINFRHSHVQILWLLLTNSKKSILHLKSSNCFFFSLWGLVPYLYFNVTEIQTLSD